MTMVSSGPISIGGNATSGGLNQSINIELGRSATATSSLNESALRTLAGVSSGAISLSNFYGKSNDFSFTISSNQTNGNLRSLAISAGWNQTSRLLATIGSGVVVSSDSTGTPGLTINGSFPNGVVLTNSGFIIGMGGRGGNVLAAGSAGGLALSVSSAVTIQNNGTIGGGGGGGGGGQGYTETQTCFDGKNYYNCDVFYPGGGGGGGRSGSTNSAGGAADSGGGTGGAGTFSAAGSGGGSGGGNGGNWGAAGQNGSYSGGAGGGAVSGNSNITWTAFGTRNGSIT
jgi:hypothetical protein